MGVNCCSNAKEAQDITITKPEKNMTSTSQNPLINNEKKIENNINQIISTNQNNNMINNLNIPTEQNRIQNQNNPFPLTEKEIDDILKGIDNNNNINLNYQPQPQPQQQVINNNITPLEQKINQNNLVRNNALNYEELLKQQNQKIQNTQVIPEK